MSSTSLATTNGNGSVPALPEDIEKVLLDGDLSKLSPQQRVIYYDRTCESLGLNPLTEPFKYIKLNGKLRLYATKDCTEQLRKIHGVSITISDRSMDDGVYIVTARATTRNGRTDESTGVVSLGNARGDTKANLLMKAETKAKRRVTLSICGLGMLDESETDSIPGAQKVQMGPNHGPSLENGTPLEADFSEPEPAGDYKTDVTLPGEEGEKRPDPTGAKPRGNGGGSNRKPSAPSSGTTKTTERRYETVDDYIARIRELAGNVYALEAWEQKHADEIQERFGQDDIQRIAEEFYRAKDEAQGAEDEARKDLKENRNHWFKVLREYRAKHNIDGDELAKRIGITRKTLTRFGNNENVSRQTIAKIAHFIANAGGQS